MRLKIHDYCKQIGFKPLIFKKKSSYKKKLNKVKKQNKKLLIRVLSKKFFSLKE